jgi:hypothetical protein
MKLYILWEETNRPEVLRLWDASTVGAPLVLGGSSSLVYEGHIYFELNLGAS